MDASSGLLMAVKQLHLPTSSVSGDNRNKRLEEAMDSIMSISHENMVVSLDWGLDDEQLVFFLEYLPGGNITDLVQKYGALEEPLATQLLRQVLSGLAHLHGLGLRHGLLTSSNVLINNKGEARISDFGMVDIYRLLSDGVVPNSPSRLRYSLTLVPSGSHPQSRPELHSSQIHMQSTAPEIILQGEPTPTTASDIWSVGCLAIEMLSGRSPWDTSDANPEAILAKVSTRIASFAALNHFLHLHRSMQARNLNCQRVSLRLRRTSSCER